MKLHFAGLWLLFLTVLLLSLFPGVSGLCESQDLAYTSDSVSPLFYEEDSSWSETPVITQAYENSQGQFYLEWTGKAPFYEVHVDGKNIKTVNVSHLSFSLRNGTHDIQIYPLVKRQNNTDTNVNIDIGGFFGAKLDLAVFGLKAEDLALGTPSDFLSVDYTADTVFSSVPSHLEAATDAFGCVTLSFESLQIVDEYQITIQSGRDTNYIRFPVHSEDAAALITQRNAAVSIILDPYYLQQKGCMIPESGKRYTFSVQLRRYAMDYLTGEPRVSVVHASQPSASYKYKVVEGWKQAPVITYAAQTADGELTLQWEHDAVGAECTYVIRKIEKTAGITTKKTELARTESREYVLKNLLNDQYYIQVVPVFRGVSGQASKSANVRIHNQWQEMPVLKYQQISDTQVRLSWECPEGIDHYHLSVLIPKDTFFGKLRLTYSVFYEEDLPAQPGAMEYTYVYDNPYDDSSEPRLKIQLFGIHLSETGEEENTETAECTVTLR